MMNKILLTTAALALVASSAFAKDAASGDKYYAKASLGYSFTDYKSSKDDNASKLKGKGLMGNLGLGVALANGFRSDLEFYADDGIKGKKTSNNIKSDFKMKTIGAFINAYFDFKNSSVVTPYVMGGIGWAHTKPASVKNGVKVKFKPKTLNYFAYQLGLGVGLAASKNVDLDLGYRFMDKNIKLKYTNNTSSKLKGNHAFLVGARFKF